MKVTFFGTTTLLFDDGRDQILFDAHFTRPSMLRYAFGSASSDARLIDAQLRRHGVDRLRAILISHTHHDHVMDAPYIALKTGAKLCGSPSALNVGRGGGVPEAQMKAFCGNETCAIGDFSIRVIPSRHSKPMLLNDDLGQTIDAPLKQPARLKRYKEGGSFDFHVTAGGRQYVIRPSFNYIEGQMAGLRADALFLGVAGLSKADAETEKRFFAETIGRLAPKLVIPLHWDNFFSPLTKPARGMPPFIERTEAALFRLARHCAEKGVCCLVQLPGTSVEL